jgi:DNA-binding MarR family transcriptional regulator
MSVDEVAAGASPDGEEMRLATLLVQLADGVKQTVRHLADEMGLSVAQIDVLRQLGVHGPTPMSRLADTLGCEASNLTGLVDRLEARHLVERQPEPGDRRVRLLALTSAGRTLSTDAWFALTNQGPIAKLDPTDRSQLLELLTKALGENF